MALPTGTIVTTVLATAVVAAVAAVPLYVYADGVDDIANHPVIVVPMALATIVLLVAASALSGASQRRTMACLAGTGLAMFGYLALTAALAWHGGEAGARDQLTQVLVAGQGAAWVPPITLLTLTFLAALAGLGHTGRAVRRIPIILAGYTGASLCLVVPTIPPPEDSPYADMQLLWDAPAAVSALATFLLVPWMLSILVAPVVAWRALPRTSRARRERVLAVALASMTPIVTIVFCLGATVLAYAAGLLSPGAGAAGLSIAFHLPFLIAAPAVVLALRGPGVRLTPQRVAAALTVFVGTPLLVVVITVAWLLADGFGGRGIALALIGTLAIGAVASAARRRLVHALLLRIDAVRARAAAALEAGSDTRDSSPAAELQRVVCSALPDPEAILALRLASGGWVHCDGTPAPRPDPPTTEQVDVRPSSEDAATALDEAGVLVDRAVLELSVRDHEAAIAAAHARAEQAAASERRRLERDLHDGVQGRLLALALDLRVAQRNMPSGERDLVIADAVEALGKAIDELRALSHGNGPELLSRRGLRAALTDFVGRMPLPVTLVSAPERLGPAAESVIYLAVCEAVTNAVKHAGATAVDIEITVEAETALVAVADDGAGGADLRAGTGLQGLAERVTATGGQLVVSDRHPHGTLLEVTVPCGS